MTDTAAEARVWEPAAIPTDTFGQRLRYIRLVLEEPISGMGKLVGVPGQTWGTWEEGTIPRRLNEVVQKVVAATRERFAPEATEADLRDWLIWGPKSRWMTGFPGQGTLFDLLVAA